MHSMVLYVLPEVNGPKDEPSDHSKTLLAGRDPKVSSVPVMNARPWLSTAILVTVSALPVPPVASDHLLM